MSEPKSSISHGRYINCGPREVLKIRSFTGFGHVHQVIADILKSCAAFRTIAVGRALHGCVVKLGLLSCQSLSKALLNMYSKCGAQGDFLKLFGQMGTSDPVVWNIVLSGLAGSKFYDGKVIGLFNAMHVANGAKPTPVTFAILLPVCVRLGDLNGGKRAHSYVIKSGLGTHTLVGNALVSFYAKCGSVLGDAYAAFNGISDKDVVSWHAIIAGFSENMFMDFAFRLFKGMLKGQVEPNSVTIMNILPVCASLDKNFSYLLGKEIHCYILRRAELGENVNVCNALVSFYLRIGRKEDADSVFQRMESRDLVSWNTIIAGYASNGEWLKAVEFFHELLSTEIIDPGSVTLISVLPACAQLQNLYLGKAIHGYVLRHPCLYEDTNVGNTLVSFYKKCNNIKAAYQTFLMITSQDLISWNCVLGAFAENAYRTQFQELLRMMFKEGIRPDSVTILTIIQHCVTFSRLEKVKETHSYAIKAGFLMVDSEPTTANAILDAYSKCGDMEYAFRIFQSLAEQRNLITFNSMISGYVNSGLHDDAIMIFNTMSDRDLTTWNLMVRAYAEKDCPEQALSLFRELQAQGMKPDAVTIMSLLPVCAHTASFHLLRQCHGYMIRVSFDDARLCAAILDVYAKCGSIECAHRLFQSNFHKDLVMFTSMVGGYAMHGMGEEALRLFSYMLELGVKPDHVIITAVLSACAHAGLVDEGLNIFYSIENVHGMKPTMEQYSCVVDLLARGGQISDAFSLVTRLPIEPKASVWGSLLGACRTHHEVELGRLVADRLFEIEASNLGNYVVMSNLYAADARWDGVMEMRKLMKTRDFIKPAGCSWIEVERRKNVFIAGDCSHPQRSSIYHMLHNLDQQIKQPFLFDKIDILQAALYC
ncbi:hypothetical protein SLA2020_395560 [Shorea laevis]